MSTRGVKFEFEPGEHVLCFEPDPSKARVLYDAKILEVSSKRDSKGQKKTAYHIHFQGWNSSWDRMVPECFVLKSTEENRLLMGRLAETARNIKNNKKRNRRIDEILRRSLKRKIEFDTDSDSTSSSSSDDDDSDEETDDFEGDDEELTYRQKRKMATNGKKSAKDAEVSRKERSRQNGHGERSDERNGVNGVKEEDMVLLELDLPLELRQILEDDSYYVAKKNRLLQLPAEPNVITVLEGYVKSLAMSLLSSDPAESSRTRHTQDSCPQPEKNINLCKEVMEGLRIFFDFTLPKILLYSCEKTQYNRIIRSFRPIIPVKREVSQLPASPEVCSPRLRSSSRIQSPTTPAEKPPPTPTPTERPPPKIPRLSPRAVSPRSAYHQVDTVANEPETSADEFASRRMTRHAYQEEIRKCQSAAVTESSKPLHGDSGRRRHFSGSELRKCSMGQQKTEIEPPCDEEKKVQRTLSERVTPPPPLLIPNSLPNTSSKGSTGSSGSPGGVEGHQGMDKEAMLSQVFQWKLVPDEVLMQQSPTPPSQIYGTHHLLRLFVKLPEMIGRMNIPDVKLQPLLKHLQQFLQYLSEHSEEFLAESCYMDDPDS